MQVTEDRFTRWSDEHYPRPQLCRPEWAPLTGEWEFRADVDEVGVLERWFADEHRFPDRIQVPFPPGSELSGLPEAVDCEVVWYRRTVTPAEVAQAGRHEDLLLHFEAVDYRADVWVNGSHVAHHEGGFTPFSAAITPYVDKAEGFVVVVRAEDRREDLSQPRGKQDWRVDPHGIWYKRSTGIWRDVWLETVPRRSVKDLRWTTDLPKASVRCEVEFSDWVPTGSSLKIDITFDGTPLGSIVTAVSGPVADVNLRLPVLANRLEWDSILWSPDHPHLLDAVVELMVGPHTDRVVSYLGVRSVRVQARYLCVNESPVYVRAVLDQGYWGQSLLTPPAPDALRADLQLCRDLGFNTVRVHQRTPDRRYLTWADRLGIMVWDEFPAAFEYSQRAVERTCREWTEVLRRDSSSPSVVVWVPFNESWGIPGIEWDPRQRTFVDGLVSVTRAMDPSRPVIANDGWEQLDSDIVTTHDYGTSRVELEVNYATVDAVRESLHGVGPQGRRILLRRPWADDRPVMVSEFGGISMKAEDDPDSWGYAMASSPEELEQQVAELFEGLYASPVLGTCQGG